MNDQSHGYDTSLGYSFGFYREMAPAWLDLCVRAAGFEPRPRGAFRYLELGCGQGLGLCLLAGANSGSEFVGVDFQPEHVAHARELAGRAGLTNVQFIEADFADLAREWPAEFGTFDYVVLHGILSWVSPELRAAVVDCLGHATHEGSLVYASYNAQPSWLGTVPFQHVARLLKRATVQPGEAVVDQAITLFEKLRAANAPIFRILPALDARLQTLRTHSPNYLVHEYLNENWQPLWHSDVAGEFARADLVFAASATIADNLLPDVLAEPLRAPIAEHENLREDVQDFAVNQGFRRDIFCRGRIPETGSQLGGVAPPRFTMVSPPEPGADIPVQTSFGQLALQSRHVAPIVQAIAAGASTFAEIAAHASLAESDLRQLLTLLLHADTLGVLASEPGQADVAQRLNASIARAACERAPYEQLAAARLGSAIRVSQIELMLLDSWIGAADRVDAGGLAAAVWERMNRLGQKLYHQGQPVDDAHAIEQLQTVAAIFIGEILPRWRELGVVE